MFSWDKVGVLCSTRHGLSPETACSVDALTLLGARDLILKGISGFALARNIALTQAATIARRHQVSVWLLVDDDISFGSEAAKQVCGHALELGHATSGVYLTSAGAPACSPRAGGRAYTGLGFLALPVAQLWELEAHSEMLRSGAREFRVFTQSGPQGGIHNDEPWYRWHNEDYWLCERLGGVNVLPVPVGHVRPGMLIPDDRTLDAVEAAMRQRQ